MPNVSLRVAVWTVDTFTRDVDDTNQFSGVNLQGRLTALSDAVNLARGWFDSFKNPVMEIFDVPGGKQLDVFIAPEYLFTVNAHRHVLEQDHLVTMEHRCRAMSAGILLIPGTITWRKPLDQARAVKAQRRLDHDRQMQNVLLSRQYAKDPERLESEIGKSRREVEDKQGAVAMSTVIGGGYVARNTAFVFRDGHRVMKYHKRADFTEVTATDQTGGDTVVFIPGEADGFFSLPDLRLDCGIEVCGDHNLGYLAHSVLRREPDIHFICSAKVWVQAEHVRVKKDGLVIHASSSPLASGVYRDFKGDPLKPDREIAVPGGGKLLCHDVTLDTR